MLNLPHDLCRLSEIAFGSHTGTHVDAPSHIIEDGLNLSQINLDKFIGNAKCVKLLNKNGLLFFKDEDIVKLKKSSVDILLLYSEWDIKTDDNNEFILDFPVFSNELCEIMISMKIKLIGTNIPTIDNTLEFNAHKKLLKRNICIVEGLINLELLLNKDFIFVCLPLKLENSDGSPVRAIAIIE